MVGKIPWRREWLPTPVFWSAEFHELYSPWGCKELDMTEQLSLLEAEPIGLLIDVGVQDGGRQERGLIYENESVTLET